MFFERIISTPIRALGRSFIDNVIRDGAEPVPGSILYCDLAVGYIEHSGIYVGDGDKCIVELTNINGHSIIQRVTPREFTSAGTGFSIYVSCHNNRAVGKKNIARTALEMVGQDIGKYNIAFNNCHMFTDYCLCRGNINCGHADIKQIVNMEMTLTHLKKRAKDILNANEWRVWKHDD